MKFHMDELIRALAMIKKDSSPGLDQIDYIIIKFLPTSALEILLGIFNAIRILGEVPDIWKKYQVVFIVKEKVRPIALSSCMGKVIERLVNERLV